MITDKKILITGSNGFIGRHLGYRLEKYNYVRWGSKQNGYDLFNYENCLRATKDIDYVFDLAAVMGGIKYITINGADIILNNAVLNINTIRASIENKVKRIFFSSSFCAYPGFKQGIGAPPLKEEDAIPSFPDTDYGWEKIFIEQLLRSLNESKRIETRCARFVSIYGKGMPYKGGQEKSIAAICRKVAEADNGTDFEIWGDGTPVRSFCYIDDCLDAIELIMESDYSEVFNISNKTPMSINEIADYAVKFSGKNLSKRYKAGEVKGVDIRIADVSKIKEKLGWEAKINNEEGMKILYDWISKEINK
jgi:GDP-D-mannose 3',5'-epimerase